MIKLLRDREFQVCLVFGVFVVVCVLAVIIN